MKNTILILVAVITLSISDIFVSSQYTPNDELNAYDYYDDFVDSSTTDQPTAPPITTPTTTTRRTTTRPSTVVYYNKPNRFVNYNNKYQQTSDTTSTTTNNYQRPRPQLQPRTTTLSPAGVNRNVVDLERSENRKDYAQSRIAEETEDEKYLSRRYARFLFNQRTG